MVIIALFSLRLGLRDLRGVRTGARGSAEAQNPRRFAPAGVVNIRAGRLPWLPLWRVGVYEPYDAYGYAYERKKED
jgi:hypothetical protein